MAEASRKAAAGDLDGAIGLAETTARRAPAGSTLSNLGHERAAEILLQRSRYAEAAAHLHALATDAPAIPAHWERLSRALRALGDAEAEIDALRRLLERDSAHRYAHKRLGGLLSDLGRAAEAVVHLEARVTVEPDAPRVWRRLAHMSRLAGLEDKELQAWARLSQLDPGDLTAHRRLIHLLSARGRLAEAVPHGCALAMADPEGIAPWKLLIRLIRDLEEPEAQVSAWQVVSQLAPGDVRIRASQAPLLKERARGLAEGGDRDVEAAAWEHALRLDPTDPEALDRLEALQQRKLRGAATPFTITVVGNCQAYSLAQCLRSLCPDAEVTSVVWHDLASEERAERIVRGLEVQDLVVSQVTGKRYFGPLRTRELRPRVRRLALFPNIHFTGFHPDLVALPRRTWEHGPPHRFGAWNSALAMAAFLRGVPQGEAANLFNAYIYEALGYFGEYAKAERYHLDEARQIDLDLVAEFAAWRRRGVFVHVPNHPVIDVPWSLARLLCERLRLPTRDVDEPPPDRLAPLARWPVYPEIARRLGVEGFLRFTPHAPSGPPVGLDEFIDEIYRAYAEADPRQLRTRRIAETVETLKREGV